VGQRKSLFERQSSQAQASIPCLGRPRKRCILADMEKAKFQPNGCAGFLWFGGWLFTIGYLRLTFWKGVLAILLWAYYLGAHFSSIAR